AAEDTGITHAVVFIHGEAPRRSIVRHGVFDAEPLRLSTCRHSYAILAAMSFVSHVECTICGHRHDGKRVLTVCERCGSMLAVRYDLERVKASVTKETLRSRPPGMYRFRELTPLDEGEEPVTLGEGSTPLLALPRLAAHFGLRHVWGKDEGQNPTGSF